MVNSIIIDYLSKYSNQYPLSSLKKKLISSGYAEADINDVIQILGLKEDNIQPNQQTNPQANEPAKKSENKNNEPISQLIIQKSVNEISPAKSSELIEKAVQKNKSSKALKITLLIIFIIVIILLAILIYAYIAGSKEKPLPGENRIVLSNAGTTATIKLKTEIENITSVIFTFVDKNQKEYNYETSEGVSELKNEYSYVIDSDKISLEDFNSISKLKVIFKYKSQEVNLSKK